MTACLPRLLHDQWHSLFRWKRNSGSMIVYPVQRRARGKGCAINLLARATASPAPCPKHRRRAGRVRPDAGGHSTIASAIPAPGRRPAGGRSPHSAPWRAGPVSRRSRPPSRSSGRPPGTPSGPRGPGSPGRAVTGASPSRCSQCGADPFMLMAGTPAARFRAGIMAGPLYREGTPGPARPLTSTVNPESSAAETGNLSRAHHQNRSAADRRRGQDRYAFRGPGRGSRLGAGISCPGLGRRSRGFVAPERGDTPVPRSSGSCKEREMNRTRTRRRVWSCASCTTS